MKRILVVDDDTGILDSTKEILELEGYQVDVDRLTTLDLRSVFTPLPEFTDITVVCPCGIMTSADETPGFTVENNTLMFNDSVVIERGDIVEVLLLKGRSTNL